MSLVLSITQFLIEHFSRDSSDGRQLCANYVPLKLAVRVYFKVTSRVGEFLEIKERDSNRSENEFVELEPSMSFI